MSAERHTLDGPLYLTERNFEAAVFRLLMQQIEEFARIIGYARPAFWIGTKSPKRGDSSNIAKRYRQPASATFEFDLDYLIISEHKEWTFAASRFKERRLACKASLRRSSIPAAGKRRLGHRHQPRSCRARAKACRQMRQDTGPHCRRGAPTARLYLLSRPSWACATVR
jgi:hypothetical protein